MKKILSTIEGLGEGGEAPPPKTTPMSRKRLSGGECTLFAYLEQVKLGLRSDEQLPIIRTLRSRADNGGTGEFGRSVG